MNGDEFFFMGPGRALLYDAPHILAMLLGILLAFIFLGRAKKPATLALVALFLALIVRAGWPFFIQSLIKLMERDAISYELFDFFMYHGHWILKTLVAVSWLLLVIAAVGWRRPGPEAAAGTTGPARYAPSPAPDRYASTPGPTSGAAAGAAPVPPATGAVGTGGTAGAVGRRESARRPFHLRPAGSHRRSRPHRFSRRWRPARRRMRRGP